MPPSSPPRSPSGTPTFHGALFGMGAAFLFGISAPLSKLMLDRLPPLALAGLLYTGAGLGLLIVEGVRRAGRARAAREAALRGRAWWLLAGATLSGGILAPVSMLFGLQRVSGVAGSLLLNLEAPFTIAVAVIVFREHLGRYAALAAALVISGAALLAWRPGELRADVVGASAIGLACLLWAVDNNLTTRLSHLDPLVIARIKSLVAGAFNLTAAYLAGHALPRPATAAWALCLGVLSFGASYVLHIRAMRLLGAARQATFFATAPFIGALAAIPLLGEGFTPVQIAAAALMAGGLAALLREEHAHLHVHEPLEHDHAHVHDEHHQHTHDGDVFEPHSHPHPHERLEHSHPHAPDLHHRHRHE